MKFFYQHIIGHNFCDVLIADSKYAASVKAICNKYIIGHISIFYGSFINIFLSSFIPIEFNVLLLRYLHKHTMKRYKFAKFIAIIVFRSTT